MPMIGWEAQDKMIPRRAVDPHAPEPIAQVMLDEVRVGAEQHSLLCGYHSCNSDGLALTGPQSLVLRLV